MSFAQAATRSEHFNACLSAGRNLRAVIDATFSQTAGPDTVQRLKHNGVLEARGSTSTEQGAVPDPLGSKAGLKAQAAAGDSRKKIPGKCDP
jgi:hypothetical protein